MSVTKLLVGHGDAPSSLPASEWRKLVARVAGPSKAEASLKAALEEATERRQALVEAIVDATTLDEGDVVGFDLDVLQAIAEAAGVELPDQQSEEQESAETKAASGRVPPPPDFEAAIRRHRQGESPKRKTSNREPTGLNTVPEPPNLIERIRERRGGGE